MMNAEEFRTVFVAASQQEAEFVCELLIDRGIESHLENESFETFTFKPLVPSQNTCAKVWVPAVHAELARKVIQQYKTPVTESHREMQSDAADSARPRALMGWCVRLSMMLAGIAEIAAILGAVIALAIGNRNPAVWILPLAWPLFYAALYGLSYGTAVVGQKGPVLEQFPMWYRAFMSKFVSRFEFLVVDTMHRVIPNVMLVVCPVFVSFLSFVILWAAITGRLNP